MVGEYYSTCAQNAHVVPDPPEVPKEVWIDPTSLRKWIPQESHQASSLYQLLIASYIPTHSSFSWSSLKRNRPTHESQLIHLICFLRSSSKQDLTTSTGRQTGWDVLTDVLTKQKWMQLQCPNLHVLVVQESETCSEFLTWNMSMLWGNLGA